MSASVSPTISSAAARKKLWLRAGAIGAVALVPLAFAGLFVGALSQSDSALDSIPAAIVNEDELIRQTDSNGDEQIIFAGRQLVTELTGSEESGFDWRITNKEEAEAQLASGEIYAILTVPDNFSESILSISTDSPQKADISIRTDDAHSYLTTTIANAVGQGLVTTFGNEITKQFITGIYSSIGEVGGSLSEAADGAGQLSDGASELSAGLSTLADGAASARNGASSFASGLTTYTDGVSALSSGLAQLSSGASVLSLISTDVSSYTASVQSLSARLAAANATLQSDPSNAAALAELASVTTALTSVGNQGYVLAPTTSGRVSGIQGGISDSAAGAGSLAAGSGQLVSGARSLASGLGGLTSGASSAAGGAGELASGVGELATGLKSGSEQVPSFDASQSKTSADVASEPVTFTVTTDNPVTDIGQVIATLFVPLGLWIGALAVFLVLRPLTRRALASTASSGRLVASALIKAGAITAAQAGLLVLLVHVSLGVAWSLLPATLGLALVMAAAFTAFHYVLTLLFGRAGLVVSLLLLAIQVTTTGGLYPIEILATPFQVLSPLLPLTYGVSAMQGIIAAGAPSSILVSVLALVAFGCGSVLVSLFALRKTRTAASLGLVPVTV
ncbi:MAG: YhgE/Pip family protein [Microbacteriaceae bacterium]